MAGEYLLDTHVALWLLLGDDRLNERAFRSRFDLEHSSLVFHQVSTWEIQIKYALGKLALPSRPESFLPKALRDSGLTYERIADDGIFFLDKLPEIHRDPFDRLLAAHAIVNGWTIISADRVFERYPVRVETIL